VHQSGHPHWQDLALAALRLSGGVGSEFNRAATTRPYAVLAGLRLPDPIASRFNLAPTTRRWRSFGLPPASLSVRFGVRAGGDWRVLAGAGCVLWACLPRGPNPLGVGLRCMVRLCGACPSGRPLGQPKTGTGVGGVGDVGVLNLSRHRALAARMAWMARSRSMASAMPSRSGFMISDHSER
jgi:hypothetical protein